MGVQYSNESQRSRISCSDLNSYGSRSVPVVPCSEHVNGFLGFEICGSPSGICGESSILKCNAVSLGKYFPDISEDRS